MSIPAAPPAVPAAPQLNPTMFVAPLVLFGWSRAGIDTAEGTAGAHTGPCPFLEKKVIPRPSVGNVRFPAHVAPLEHRPSVRGGGQSFL